MIDFVPMGDGDYESWKKASVEGYAEENVLSGRWTREESALRSGQEFAKLLPYGMSTPDNYLYSLVDDHVSGPIGMLWFAVVQQESGKKQAFIYDFLIYDKYRRRGYATQALARLEDSVKQMGLHSISLHVFAHNVAARELYGKVGYRETNVMMSKELG